MEQGKFMGADYIEEVAAYIRVSSQEQKLHGISLDAQIAKLTEYAKAHNMKIVEWYKDEGVSGRKLIKKRPELQRMIEDAENRKFKRIIFIKLDRFFRSVAEYHECMKRLQTGGVIWTATEEKYDLSTASGEAFVNMKLTMAQFEADQTSERIKMVNEYKIKTGQPLFGSGSFPFCYHVTEPENGERHKYVGKREAEIMYDLIAEVKKKRSVRAAVLHVNQKYGRTFGYKAAMNALQNEMIYGFYRGNPNYCEPYISKDEFDEIQAIIKRNPRTSNTERTYIFSGLIRCPCCGNRLSGATLNRSRKGKNGVKHIYIYPGYRCQKHNVSSGQFCSWSSMPFESRIEKELLTAIEEIVQRKKINVISMRDAADKVSKYNLPALQDELDRLNYSWQKGRIKTVEEYDKRYDALMEQIEAAQNEQASLNDAPDYEKIQQILCSGWKETYAALDAEHKRAFWRSFVEEIELAWNKDEKRVIDIKFF